MYPRITPWYPRVAWLRKGLPFGGVMRVYPPTQARVAVTRTVNPPPTRLWLTAGGVPDDCFFALGLGSGEEQA